MVAAKSRLGLSIGSENDLWIPSASHRDGKLNLGAQSIFSDHRDGWEGVLRSLSTLHNAAGTEFDGFLERNFAWMRASARGAGRVPYLNPWVGCFHNPPNIPPWFEYQSAPDAVFRTADMLDSLPYCRGIFVFSKYLRDYLSSLVDVEVVALRHPTNLEVPRFSPDAFLANDDKGVYLLGSWLRRVVALRHLDTQYPKRRVIGNPLSRHFENIEIANTRIENEYGEFEIGTYEEIDRLSNDEYDDVLTRNIVFLELYDSSANNTVVECLARSTPLVVNRLPALEEYLGPDYPLFYESVDEAGRICDDTSLILEGHRYLEHLDKRPFSYDAFRQSFVDSSIYKALPGPGRVHFAAESVAAPIDRRQDLEFVQGTTLSNPFIFVVSFRNQAENICRCLESITRHHDDYDYAIVVIDDASEDGGLDRARQYLSKVGSKYVAIRNGTRKHYTRNLYNAVHLVCTNDESIILEIDGDDRLEDRDVLGCIERHYRDGALKTVGRFRVEPGESAYPGREFLRDRRLADLFDTRFPWDLDTCFSWMHLKTFKRKLFRAVPIAYFLERGGERWLEAAEDLCVHPKMVELAPQRTVFVDEVLYVYNFEGSDHEVLKAEHAEYVISKLYQMPKGSHMAQLRAEVCEEKRKSHQRSGLGVDISRNLSAVGA